MDIVILILTVIIIIMLAVVIVLLLKNRKGEENDISGDIKNQTSQLKEYYSDGNRSVLDQIGRQTDSVSGVVKQNIEILGKNLENEQKNTRDTVKESLDSIGTNITEMRKESKAGIDGINSIVTEKMQSTLNDRIDNLNKTIVDSFTGLGKNLRDEQSRQLQIINENMKELRRENSESLDKINGTVNEKLQKTLDDKISQSFDAVNKRLAEVYTSLGEMKNVAAGVTDLQKILSNVKTRGIVGEIQLSAILDDILSHEQYDEQVMIKKGTTERVDFVIKLPGAEEGKCVLLPIDSKFPGDTYSALVDAYDTGDKALIDEKKKILKSRLREEAKSINSKYIVPPETTEFAIMFLPFEGLYSEAVNMGLVEILQREYRVNIAGPSTMAALLNSLKMGFRTLAIQKKSGEVWSVLGAVKKEFQEFGDILDKTQKKLREADNNLDLLVGRRTRAINKQLDKIDDNDINEASVNLIDSI